MHGAALAGKAAEGSEASSGIPSRTLASWQMAWANERHPLGTGDILVIDEAGMVSSRQLAQFVQTVERSGAKPVSVGDPEQLQPIVPGAGFRACRSAPGSSSSRRSGASIRLGSGRRAWPWVRAKPGPGSRPITSMARSGSRRTEPRRASGW
ncbi:AAA family ATPase [Methylobacterium indicum]|uniref:AAA family ATPase n=1 Tax=Methylobacterium indicum TaxID=1775910 RepID=UPI001FCB7A31|nr:AAA family ATPase [Methylobacterium indicum]